MDFIDKIIDIFIPERYLGSYLNLLPEELIIELFKLIKGESVKLINISKYYRKTYIKFLCQIRSGLIDPDIILKRYESEELPLRIIPNKLNFIIMNDKIINIDKLDWITYIESYGSYVYKIQITSNNYIKSGIYYIHLNINYQLRTYRGKSIHSNMWCCGIITYSDLWTDFCEYVPINYIMNLNNYVYLVD